MTVSSGTTSAASKHSMCVERWSSAQLAGTPATGSASSASGAPSATLTTAAANSVVSWANGDWSGTDPATKVYRSSATEESVWFPAPAGDTTQYYAYQAAGSAGSQTFGLTAPATQRFAIVGIEIQDAAGAATVGQVIRRNPGRGLILRGRR
jgi:hypothetical protein